MAKIVDVQKNIESEIYPGVYFRDVSFADLKEYRTLAKSLDLARLAKLKDADESDMAAMDEAMDAMDEIRPLMQWMWDNVMRAEDGTTFEDACADPSVAGVVMSMQLFGEFQDLSKGNSQPRT